MMQLTDIIDIDAIYPDIKAASKKQLLQQLADLAGKITGIDPRQIFESLLQREKLGSTGLGNGIAIPHGKFPQLENVRGLFGRLRKPVEFDSVDGEPVDLIFVLLAPESAGADHLKALARISRLLRDSATVSKLRGTSDKNGLYAVLTEPASANAA